jgi:hypothetical protein
MAWCDPKWLQLGPWNIVLPSRSLRVLLFFPENYYINCRWVLRKITSVTYALIYLFILISLAVGYNMLQSGDWSSMLVISPQLHPNLQPWVPIHKQHPLLVVSVVHSFAQGNILMNQRRNRKSPYYINLSIYLSIYLSTYLRTYVRMYVCGKETWDRKLNIKTCPPGDSWSFTTGFQQFRSPSKHHMRGESAEISNDSQQNASIPPKSLLLPPKK